MVTVRKSLCPTSRYSIKCPYTRTPTRIVVHNTGNDAPAANEVSYMLNRLEEISFHVAVDDKEVVEAIPFNRNAWASGDGHGKGNMEGIHIEICYSLSGGPRFTAAEKNAAEYIASLLKNYGWGIEKVTKHQDYDGKYCPHRTLDLGWGRFLNMVKAYMKTETEDEEMTQERFNQMMDAYLAERDKKAADNWAKPAIAMCREWKIMEGDDTGNMRPQSFIKREEAAQLFYSLLGRGQDADPWAKEVWDKAVIAGVFDGTNPRAPLTREQAAMVLYRLGLFPNAPEAE